MVRRLRLRASNMINAIAAPNQTAPCAANGMTFLSIRRSLRAHAAL
jgi:hypothetical protein